MSEMCDNDVQRHNMTKTAESDAERQLVGANDEDNPLLSQVIDEIPSFLPPMPDLTPLAYQAISDVLRDKKAPAAARVSAANSVLDRNERAKEREERAAAARELEQLSTSDLERIILQLALKRAAANATDAQVIEGAPALTLKNQ